jgi:hypothetical protein
MTSSWLNSLIDFLKSLAKYLLDGFIVVIKGTLYFIFDGLLTVIQLAITSIDIASLGISTALNWAGLPTQTIYLINKWGIPQAMIIVSGAIGIRMLINLIPAEFTRL